MRVRCVECVCVCGRGVYDDLKFVVCPAGTIIRLYSGDRKASHKPPALHPHMPHHLVTRVSVSATISHSMLYRLAVLGAKP